MPRRKIEGSGEKYGCSKHTLKTKGADMFIQAKAYLRRTKERIFAALSDQKGEFYVDKVIGMIIAVVVGALLLTLVYGLFKDTVMPGLADKIAAIFA